MTERPTTVKSLSPLARELLEVAKRGGLQDLPALLDLSNLLALPIVAAEAEGASESLARAAALVRVLSRILTSLSQGSTARTREDTAVIRRRKMLLDGLFQRTDEWKDKKLTWRRQKLAGVGDRGYTSSFSRAHEFPLYGLIERMLVFPEPPIANTGELGDDPPPTSEPQRNALAHAAYAVHHEIDRWLFSLLTKGIPMSDTQRLSTRRAERMLREVVSLSEELYRGPHDYGPFDALYNALYWYGPFDDIELSRLRLAQQSGGSEVAPFIDYLRDDAKGKAAFAQWLSWLGSCDCTLTSDEQLELSPSCQPHQMLAKFTPIVDELMPGAVNIWRPETYEPGLKGKT